jgi:hypothetical protein
MPETAEAPTKKAPGGRPRLYADQGALEALMGRVALLEVGPRRIESGGVPAALAPDDAADRKFIGDCIVALIASGRYSGGDGDLPGMYAVASAMLISRDLIATSIGTLRESRFRTLRENGSLGWAGIHPESEA